MFGAGELLALPFLLDFVDVYVAHGVVHRVEVGVTVGYGRLGRRRVMSAIVARMMRLMLFEIVVEVFVHVRKVDFRVGQVLRRTGRARHRNALIVAHGRSIIAVVQTLRSSVVD